MAHKVANRRRKVKRILVEEAGSVCFDCGYNGPPFMFDFDHRNPEEKALKVSSGNTVGIDKLREEVKKCDLVCANCHRWRTHKQRCDGCEYC